MCHNEQNEQNDKYENSLTLTTRKHWIHEFLFCLLTALHSMKISVHASYYTFSISLNLWNSGDLLSLRSLIQSFFLVIHPIHYDPLVYYIELTTIVGGVKQDSAILLFLCEKLVRREKNSMRRIILIAALTRTHQKKKKVAKESWKESWKGEAH